MEELVNSYPKKDSQIQIPISIIKNPIQCDCNIYHLLRYIKGDMSKEVVKVFNLVTEHLFCKEVGLSLHNISYATHTCQLQRSEFASESACGINGKCECRFRPHDKTLFVDCSNRNLDAAPSLSDNHNASQIELDLSSNNLTEIPNLSQTGYDEISLLDLSANKISNITNEILLGNLKVLINMHK